MPDPTTPTATLSLTDIIGMVIDSVKAVEAAFPAGAGKQKFDAVYSQILAYAPLASVAASILQAWLPFLINTTVTVFNKIGAFVHGTTAAAAAPAA